MHKLSARLISPRARTRAKRPKPRLEKLTLQMMIRMRLTRTRMSKEDAETCEAAAASSDSEDIFGYVADWDVSNASDYKGWVRATVACDTASLPQKPVNDTWELRGPCCLTAQKDLVHPDLARACLKCVQGISRQDCCPACGFSACQTVCGEK